MKSDGAKESDTSNSKHQTSPNNKRPRPKDISIGVQQIQPERPIRNWQSGQSGSSLSAQSPSYFGTRPSLFGARNNGSTVAELSTYSNTSKKARQEGAIPRDWGTQTSSSSTRVQSNTQAAKPSSPQLSEKRMVGSVHQPQQMNLGQHSSSISMSNTFPMLSQNSLMMMGGHASGLNMTPGSSPFQLPMGTSQHGLPTGSSTTGAGDAKTDFKRLSDSGTLAQRQQAGTQQISVASLPSIYQQELDQYRASAQSLRERERYISWLEDQLREYGMMQQSQVASPVSSSLKFGGILPSLGSTNGQVPASMPSSTQGLTLQLPGGQANQAHSSDQPKSSGKSFGNREYLEGGDTPDLIHDKKLGRVNFIQPGSVPAFIEEELRSTPGNGQFTICELMVTLCFAHQLLFHRNTYSTIKKRMQNKRSRASIRRKIEKIVFKETGIDGGLLMAPKGKRVQILSCLWSRFSKLINEAIVYGSPSLEAFSKQLRNYANVANATEENISSGVAWKIKEPENK